MFDSIHVRCYTKESSLRFFLSSVFLGFRWDPPCCSLILLTTCQHRSTAHFTNTMGNIAQHELSETVEMSMLYGIRAEYWETFLLVYLRQLRQFMQECSIFGDSDVAGNIPVQTRTEKLLQKVESKAETLLLRDFCEDRQP